MAQLSIFDKQRHFSNKDMTISVGKGDYIYITFRHDSWKRFTDFNRITVSVNNNTLIFGTPGTDQGVSFKLKMTHGNPETFEHTRYIQISGKAWPAILEAARNMAGSYDFDKIVLDPTPEQVEEFKEKWQECNEPVEWKPLADPVPKGFIELHGAAANERILVRASDIKEIFEVLPGARFRPSTFLLPDERDANTIIIGHGSRCVLETFEVVMEKMRKALEV